MATKWKLPRTKRDVYKLLDSVGDAHDDGCVPVLTAVDGGVSDGENNRQNAADVRRCDPSPGVDSEFGNSSQIELADMVRRKIHFGEDSINHDGSKRPNSRDSRDSDFVDMARTREHTDLDRLQEKGVSPLLPSVDELDSPTKDEPKKESPKRQRGKKQLTKDQVDYELGQASFSYFDIFIYLVSIGSYVADVGSDCWVAYLYYSGKHWTWFGLTVAFITVPSVVMTSFSLKWYIVDHVHDKRQRRKPASVVRWASRFAFMMLQLSPMLRYIDSLIFGCKSRRNKEHQKKLHWFHLMLYEDTDSCLLRLIECFMEAAPQLVLQLYIMCKLGAQDGLLVLVGQAVASVTSLCSLAWSLTAYHKALRASLPNKRNMTYGGMALQFCWRFFTVAARVIALALFAARFSHWVFVVIASHWMTMFVWIRAMATDFCDTRVEELGFNLVAAAIYVFCYLNLIEGHTRLRYVFYYSVTFLEDALLISVWYMFTQTRYVWYQSPAIAAVFSGYVIGITFQVIYYLKAHPNNFPPDKSKAIRPWIPPKEILTAPRQKPRSEGDAPAPCSQGSARGHDAVANGNGVPRDRPGETGGATGHIAVHVTGPEAAGMGERTPMMQPSPQSRETSV